MLGRTNTGGGGVGGVLTVTAPAGVTVSVSKDGKVKTKTANAEGIAVFKGLKTGTWQLTITDGSQTSTKPVVITADYSTVIAFFMATIAVTYPAGSTCTCTDGVTTLTAPDTSGTWNCIVPNVGTWTFTITDGQQATTKTVTITTDGQSENIALDYRYYIVKDGKLMVNVTTTRNSVYKENGGYLEYAGVSSGYPAMYHEVDLSDYKSLNFTGVPPTSGNKILCVWEVDAATPSKNNFLESIALSEECSLPVDTLSGDYLVGICTEFTNVTKIENLYLCQ